MSSACSFSKSSETKLQISGKTVTDIIMHLSNQLNDDIKATVHGDTELVIEVNGK